MGEIARSRIVPRASVPRKLTVSIGSHAEWTAPVVHADGVRCEVVSVAGRDIVLVPNGAREIVHTTVAAESLELWHGVTRVPFPPAKPLPAGFVTTEVPFVPFASRVPEIVSRTIVDGADSATFELETGVDGARWRHADGGEWSRWYAKFTSALGTASAAVMATLRARARRGVPTYSVAVLVAAASLGDGNWPQEEIALAAWRMWPARFGLRGYESKYPAAHYVFAKLASTDRLVARGYIEHTGVPRTFRVTAKGHQAARRGSL